jgi:hypothetical protein
VRIAGESVDVVDVALGGAILPRIAADDLLLLLPCFAIPDQRRDARIFHALHGKSLRFVERVIEIDRQPWMAINDLLFDRHHVHDRENAGFSPVGDFFLLPVREQPRHPRILLYQRLDEIGMQTGVELALGEQAFHRLVGRKLGDLQAGRRRKVDRLVKLGHPFDRLRRHAVLGFEYAAHPDDRGGLELFDADPFADQVGRFGDALAGVDEHEAVAEAAMQEHRDCDCVGDPLIARHHVGRA